MLLICIIPVVNIALINNVQGGKNDIGEGFVNIKHSFLAVCRKVIQSGSSLYKIPLLF